MTTPTETWFYESADTNCPDWRRWCAQLVAFGKRPNTGERYHTTIIILHAPTKEGAEAKVADWWEREKAAAAKRESAKVARLEGMARARAEREREVTE